MTMVKRNRLRSARPKAVFGTDGAIMAAATLAAAGIGAAATYATSKDQIKIAQENAKQEAENAKLQREQNNELVEKQIALDKEQFDREQDTQNDLNRNLLLLAGQNNMYNMRENAKIQVKHGGNMRRKLRNTPTTFLRGRNGNLPFTVTDGGDVLPLGTTPEGYDLYEIIGNDHEHYHKTKGGKYKSGVGIKFPNGTIEGEGNQNKEYGEVMLITPDDAMFYTVHNLHDKETGITVNPGKEVLNGGDPLEWFDIQETIKKRNGITDDGKYGSSTPVRRMHPYGGISTLNVSPDLSLDFMAPVATGILAGTRQDNIAKYGRSLKKCGGRRKAAYGWDLYGGYPTPHKGFYQMIDTTYPQGTTNNGSSVNRGYNTNSTARGNLWGAGYQAIGNIGGALLTVLGNRAALKYTNAGNESIGNYLRDTWNNLPVISEDLINNNDYKAAHAFAALQAPNVRFNDRRARAERSLQRNLTRINNNTLSSAADQNRSARAEIDYNDNISSIGADEYRANQDIGRQNVQNLIDLSKFNANAVNEASRAKANAKQNLWIEHYNQLRENKMGASQYYSDYQSRIASNTAATRQANFNSLANAFNSSLSGFANTLATNSKMRNELEMTMLGASTENQYNYYLNNPYAPGFEAFANRFKNVGGNYEGWYDNLMKARRI